MKSTKKSKLFPFIQCLTSYANKTFFRTLNSLDLSQRISSAIWIQVFTRQSSRVTTDRQTERVAFHSKHFNCCKSCEEYLCWKPICVAILYWEPCNSLWNYSDKHKNPCVRDMFCFLLPLLPSVTFHPLPVYTLYTWTMDCCLLIIFFIISDNYILRNGGHNSVHITYCKGYYCLEIFTNFYIHVVQVHQCEEVAQSSPLKSLLDLFQIVPRGSPPGGTLGTSASLSRTQSEILRSYKN